MNRLVCIVITLCLTSAFACSSSKKVDLFRVNDNGEVVNIGASQDDNVLYGHFMSENEYQKARLSMTSPIEKVAMPVCYIEMSQGEGIRIEPCGNAVMVNEGPVLFAPLDVIGIYHIEGGSWGTYELYAFENRVWSKSFSAPILDKHWQSGIDVVRKEPNDPTSVFFTTSKSDGDVEISVRKIYQPMGVVLVPENADPKAIIAPIEEVSALPMDVPVVESEAVVDTTAMPIDEVGADAGDVTPQESATQE